MADKLVTIARFTDSVEADLARQLLSDSGIEAVVAGRHAADVYAGLPSIAAAELQVFESRADEALRILQSGTGEGEQEE